MSTQVLTHLILNAVLFIAIIITGRIMHNSGSPYSALLSTVHKILSLAFVIILFLLVKNYHSSIGLNIFLWVGIGLLTAALIILFATGGVMAAGKGVVALPFVHMLSTIVVLVGYVVLVIKYFA